jgi:Mechanosensitive ion channel, conserved TM helix
MGRSFADALLAALTRFFAAVVDFLPDLLAAIVIIVIGAVVGWLLMTIVRRGLQLTRFDHFCSEVGVSQVLGRADIRSKPAALAGLFTFWLVFAAFVAAGLTALGVAAITHLMEAFVLYLPKLLSALAILLLGFLLGNFLSRATLLAAVNANAPSPRAFALVVKLLIAVLAFAMALEQLSIATSIVLAAFVILFGATMLALALAFGLGGRDIAHDVLARHLGARGGAGADRDELSHV